MSDKEMITPDEILQVFPDLPPHIVSQIMIWVSNAYDEGYDKCSDQYPTR